MTNDTLTSDVLVTITRDPNDPTKDYKLPIDLAEVLYQSGQLEKIKTGKMTRYVTPNIDDPKIGLHNPTFDPRELELATNQGIL